MKLLIADDHPLFRLGLKAMLEREGFKHILEAENGLDAVEKALKYQPGAILMDIKMPELDGIEATRELRRRGYGGFIIMLTTFSEPALQVAAYKAGANAYLLKEASALEVARTLHDLETGHRTRFKPPTLPDLTEREMEVLTGLSKGRSAKEIAFELGLSPETVRDYIKKLYLKLGAHSRVEALEVARRLGLI